MATAVRSNRIHLSLEAEQADALLALCGHIGGGPATSRRHIDAIYEALKSAVGHGSRVANIRCEGSVAGVLWFEADPPVQDDSNVTRIH
jgi:hypothetical protein